MTARRHDRRHVLLAVTAAMASPAAVHAAVRIAARDAGAAFDPRDPRDNLRALVKLQGALDGSPGVTYTSGRLLRVRAGELAQPLLGFARCQVRVFGRRADGRFACAKHNWMMCSDPGTGEFVTEYRDPAMGLKPAPSFVVRNTPMIYGVDGLRWTRIRTEPALVATPLRLDWERLGDEGSATLAYTLRTAQADGHLGVETASTTMGFRWADLLGEAPHSDCVVSDLLQVDERAARARAGPAAMLLYVGTGRRLAGIDALPPAFARESERRFPGILADLPVPAPGAV